MEEPGSYRLHNSERYRHVQSIICASFKSERFQYSILPSPKISEPAWRGCYITPLLIHLHRAKEHPSRPILETSHHRAIPGGASSCGNVACFALFSCTLTMDHMNGSDFTAVGAQPAFLKLAAELLSIEEEDRPFSWQISCCHEAAVVQASCAVLWAVGKPWLSTRVSARLTWVHRTNVLRCCLSICDHIKKIFLKSRHFNTHIFSI